LCPHDIKIKLEGVTKEINNSFIFNTMLDMVKELQGGRSVGRNGYIIQAAITGYIQFAREEYYIPLNFHFRHPISRNRSSSLHV
jgi:hypothetical protein